MKQKNIDFLREIRLWGKEIIVPICATIVCVPQIRTALKETFKETKNKIQTKRLTKEDKEET